MKSFTMKKNMGAADKIIRVLIALVVGILIYANVLSGTWALVAGIAALVLVATSLFRFCPLYALFGIHTCRETP
jgi:hypothetical protein